MVSILIKPNCFYKGSTPSSGTGPSGAKTGSHYLYVETSSPVPVGAKFQFESPYISGKEHNSTRY